MNNKRKIRHLVSYCISVLTGATIALILLAANYEFAVYDPENLAASFEKSDYFNEQKQTAEQALNALAESADLPEGFLDMDDYADDFERDMRSQVYGRNDRVADLESIGVAEILGERLDSQGIKRTIQSDMGILKLGDDVSAILRENSQVPGMEEWWAAKEQAGRVSVVLAASMTVLLIAECLVLWLIQTRKKQTFRYLSVAAFLGGAAGMIGTVCLYKRIRAPGGEALAAVWEIYRTSMLTTGMKLAAVALLIGLILAVIRIALRGEG